MDYEESPDMQAYDEGAQMALPILVTTVDIGQDRSEQIELREGDSPEDAATAFCARHGLPAEVAGPLAAHMADNLARALLSPGVTPAGSQCGEPDYTEAPEDNVPEVGEYAPEEDSPFPCRAASSDSLDFGDCGGCHTGYTPHVTGELPSPNGGGSNEPGAFVASELPEAAARLAEGCVYTAPPSPTKRGKRTAATAEVEEASAVAAGEAEEAAEDRLWGGGGGGLVGRMHVSQHGACARLFGHARQREQRLEEERRLRDAAVKAKQSSYKLAISARSRQLVAGRGGAGEYKNHGERMYVDGVMALRRKEQLAEEAAAEKAAAELAEVTLKPRISAAAQRLRGSGGSDPGRLSRPCNDKKQERLAAMKAEKEAAAVADCTFRPVINRRSEHLTADRSTVLREHHISPHDQLYQDATRRAARASEYQYWFPEEVTFQPAVNPPRRPAPGRTPAPEAEPVQDRLYAVARRTADKLEAARSAAPVDPATGRPLFVPATGRAPQQPRNHAGAPVGEYLYRIGQEHSDKKGVLDALSEQKRQRAATATYTTSKSNRMVGELKAKRFSQIFEYLDRTGTGALDLVTLAFGKKRDLVESLDGEVRADVEAAARLLSKRVASGTLTRLNRAHTNENAPPGGKSPASAAACEVAPVTVSLPEFAVLMEEVLAKSHHPRAYLLPSQAARKKWEEHTFQPATNCRSLALAQRRRPADQKGYDILHATAAAVESRRQSRRQAAADAEMQACTFKPALLPPRRRSSGSGHAEASAATPGPAAAAAACAAASVAGEAAMPATVPQLSGSACVGGTAAMHRSTDHHAKYTSLEAQVRAAMEETAALTGMPPVTHRPTLASLAA